MIKRYGSFNLSNSPKTDDLIALLSQCNDNEGHHILWVDFQGNVYIDLLPEGKAPAWWGKTYEGKYKFRWETFGRGNGYVGVNAANNSDDVEKMLQELLNNWSDNRTGYVDY